MLKAYQYADKTNIPTLQYVKTASVIVCARLEHACCRVISFLVTYLCPETHSKCANHYCVPNDAICNYTDECGDNSDEEKCGEFCLFFKLF